MEPKDIPDPTTYKSPRGSHQEGESSEEKVIGLLDRGMEAIDRLLDHLDHLEDEEGPSKDRPLWDVDEVADYLDVSKRTVETLIANGELEPVRVRSLRRFKPSEIRDYCRRKR